MGRSGDAGYLGDDNSVSVANYNSLPATAYLVLARGSDPEARFKGVRATFIVPPCASATFVVPDETTSRGKDVHSIAIYNPHDNRLWHPTDDHYAPEPLVRSYGQEEEVLGPLDDEELGFLLGPGLSRIYNQPERTRGSAVGSHT